MNTSHAAFVYTDVHKVLDMLACVYLRNNRPKNAAALLRAMEAMGRTDARLLSTLALAQIRAGAPENALATLERIASRGGIDAAYYLIRAQAQLALGHREKAGASMQAYVAARLAMPAVAGPTGRAF